MTKEKVNEFISKQKTAFISSVDEKGFPITRAMLAPREIDCNDIYFTTNTSSNKVKQYVANNKACICFYESGRFKYQGAQLKEQWKFAPTKKQKIEFGDLVIKCFIKKA